MKTLLGFSGGLDSTYLLHRLLTMTDDEVVCFWMDLTHIERVTAVGRVPYYNDLLPAERIIAPRVIGWMGKNVRPVAFEVVKGVIYEAEPDDFPKGSSRGWRVIPMLKCAARQVVAGSFDRFVYGKSPENIRTPNQPARDRWYQEWWAKAAPKTTFETPLIELWHGRPHALASLPADVQALMLTCNDPRFVDMEPMACNACEKCMLTFESRRLLANGCDPDAILDFLLRRRKAGPYIESMITGDKRLGGDLNPSAFPPVE